MPIKAIITDIEGTTTSISFVKDSLFPYAVEHVQQYLDANWNEADVQEAIKELRAQYADDVTNKVEGVVTISDAEGKEQAEQIAEIVANVKWQISIDRKTTSLKKLQGLIWAKGYNSGAIKGHVYSDVPKAFERWTADSIKIYIYSSGSVAAQKLLFANSVYGDLTSNITGYFDTQIGAKQETESYEKIVKEVGCEPVEILFLTDIINEAVAAKQSGINVAILVREGNGPLTDEQKADYQLYTSFDDIQLEFNVGKRKMDEVVNAETKPAKIPKLSDDEPATVEANAAKIETETNGIRTDINDIEMETHVSNGADNETMKNEAKTEMTNDIPITKQECDPINKTVNLDVGVVEEDINKREKDSNPQTVDEVIKTKEALPMPMDVDDNPDEIPTVETPAETAAVETAAAATTTETAVETAADEKPVETAAAETPVATAAETPVETPAVETPVEAASVEKPVETAATATPAKKAVETAAAEKPVETAAAETPVETAAAETPVETAAAETPVETAAAETPVETPAVQTAADEKPVETAAADSPVETAAVATPVEKAAAAATPAETAVETPTAKTSVETAAVETHVETAAVGKPVETAAAETPVETATAETPVETAAETHAETAAVDTPMETAAAETPVETPTVETPVETTAAATPAETAVEKATAETSMEVEAAEIPATEKPATEVSEVPSTEVPATDIPATKATVTDVPVEKPATEVSVAEVPVNELPAAEVQTTELPTTKVPTTELQATEDIEMAVDDPIVKEVAAVDKPKLDVAENNESVKIVEDISDVAEQVAVIPETMSVDKTDKIDLPEKIEIDEIVENDKAERPTEDPLKQNGNHTDDNVENENAKTEEKKQDDKQTNINVVSESDTNEHNDMEVDKNESDEKVATCECAKENEVNDNKENIPVEVKEKENIIEIPIHIDGDNQSAQKPSIVPATNGNGVTSSKDESLDGAATATNSNKEKMSRIELIIEEKNNDNGQLTETTTHFLKEVIIKTNVCESAENVEIIPETV